MALTVESAEHLQCLLRDFGRIRKKMNLRVDAETSKVIVVGREEVVP